MPRPSKLSDEQQYQVCKWYAEFKTPTQIQRLVKGEFGHELTIKNIWQYGRGPTMKKWKPMIERLRQEWALGVMDIPLAHKRARLEKLVLLLGRAERLNLESPSGKDMKVLRLNPGTLTERDKIRLQVEILRELREEMEAGKAEFTNVYLTTIHNYSDTEILKQRDAVLARLKQLKGGGHGTRNGSEESAGAVEVEAVLISGGDGGGGGPDQRRLGQGDGADALPAPEPSPQSV